MKIIKSVFSKTVMISGFIVFIFLLIGFISLASLFIFSSVANSKVESKLTVIAYSTQTPEISTKNPIVPLISSPNPNNIIFSKGLKINVKGTEGEGLRLHQSAGQESPTVYLASEGDLYLITDGPIITGGYVWWQIHSLITETIVGWAVQDFLQLNLLSQ